MRENTDQNNSLRSTDTLRSVLYAYFGQCQRKSSSAYLSWRTETNVLIKTKDMYLASLFSTLKLKCLAYLFNTPSVCNWVYYVKHHVSTKMYFIACLLEERFVTLCAVK